MLQYVYDVAFNRNVQYMYERSFDNTIDATFGIYKGMLSINLAPSGSANGPDWPINFDFWKTRVKPSYAKLTSKVKVHRGYMKQWEKHRSQFFEVIVKSGIFMNALSNGLVVSGRSKGGAEASIIALDIVRNFNVLKSNIYVGLLNAPKIGNKAYKLSVEKYIPKYHIYTVRYCSDIVTMLVPTYKNPGDLIQMGKRKKLFSFKDHVAGCYSEDLLMEYVKDWDGRKGNPYTQA